MDGQLETEQVYVYDALVIVNFPAPGMSVT